MEMNDDPRVIAADLERMTFEEFIDYCNQLEAQRTLWSRISTTILEYVVMTILTPVWFAFLLAQGAHITWNAMKRMFLKSQRKGMAQ